MKSSSRNGFTLTEILVLLLIAGIVGTLVLRLRSQGARRAQQIEAGTDQVRAALLLRAHLSRDLSVCLPRSVLSEDELALDESETELVIPIFAGYDGALSPSLRYRPLRYRWVDGEGLKREGQVVLGQGLSRVLFQWESGGETLVVSLVSPRKKTADLKIVFPLASSRDRAGWIRAPHHQSAEAKF